MHKKQTAKTLVITLIADEPAQAVAEHCRREHGMLLPEGRAYPMVMTADGQAVRKLKVHLKW